MYRLSQNVFFFPEFYSNSCLPHSSNLKLGGKIKENKIKIGPKTVLRIYGEKTEKLRKWDRKLDFDGGQ